MLINLTKDYIDYLPRSVSFLENPQKDIPRIAKNKILLKQIESAVQHIPTIHNLYQADARSLSFVNDESIHLVLTSPPYWTLKKYRDNENQLGEVEDYERFLNELDKVWNHCYRMLVPGVMCVYPVGRTMEGIPLYHYMLPFRSIAER